MDIYRNCEIKIFEISVFISFNNIHKLTICYEFTFQKLELHYNDKISNI